MEKLKIRKIGNSLGTILPTEVVRALHLKEGDSVYLTRDADGVHITPYDPDFEANMEAFEEGRRAYRNALRELAK